MSESATAHEVIVATPFRGGVLRLLREKPLPSSYGGAIAAGTYGIHWDDGNRSVRIDSMHALEAETTPPSSELGPQEPERVLELARIFAVLLEAGRVVDDVETAALMVPTHDKPFRCPYRHGTMLVFAASKGLGMVGDGLEFTEWNVDLGDLSSRRAMLGQAR